jgi:hypothetical protein
MDFIISVLRVAMCSAKEALVTSKRSTTSAAAVLWFLVCRHQLFVDMVRQNKQDADDAAAAAALEQQQVKGTRPADLPVYGQEFLSRQ